MALTAANTKITKQQDQWEITVSDLPQYENQQPVTYWLMETRALGYEAPTYNDIDKTFTNKLTRTEISGKKTWDNNQDPTIAIPATIEVYLVEGATRESGVEVAGSRQTIPTVPGTYSWDDLPAFKNQQPIKYWVVEAPQAGFVASYTGNDIHNETIEKLTEVSVVKFWEDNSDQDGKRPTSLTLELFEKGGLLPVASQTLKAADFLGKDQWTYTFTDLPKYRNGQEIQYEVKESYSGNDYQQQSNQTNSKGIIEIVNVHEPEKTEIPVVKFWDDNSDQDGKRPTALTLELFEKGGQQALQSKTLQATDFADADRWTYTFTGLPKYQKGQLIAYEVKEQLTGSDYTQTTNQVNQAGVVEITNFHQPEETDIPVVKFWDDAKNQDGKRPETLELALYEKGGTLKLREKTLSLLDMVDEDHWQYTFTGLPKYRNGQAIQYEVREKMLNGDYVQTANAMNQQGIIEIVNAHQPEKIQIPVTKKWIEYQGDTSKRPTEITYKLYADDSSDEANLVDTVTVKDDHKDNDSTTWYYTFTDLDKYRDGKEITYILLEEQVTDYQAPIVTGDNTGFTVENAYRPEEKKDPYVVKGTKYWEGDEGKESLRTAIKLHLTYGDSRDKAEKIPDSEITVDTKTDWEYQWSLDSSLYPDPEKIWVVEEKVDGYQTSYLETTADEKDRFSVLNTYEPPNEEEPPKEDPPKQDPPKTDTPDVPSTGDSSTRVRLPSTGSRDMQILTISGGLLSLAVLVVLLKKRRN